MGNKENDCMGLMGKIFGHRFIPILTYDASIFGEKLEGLRCSERTALKLAEKYRQKVFHGCVCKRCGKILQKDNSL